MAFQTYYLDWVLKSKSLWKWRDVLRLTLNEMTFEDQPSNINSILQIKLAEGHQK